MGGVSKLTRSQSLANIHREEQKAPVAHKEYRQAAYKANVIDKLKTKLREFFHLNCTKLGRLEKQEQKIVKELNHTMAEIMKIEKQLDKSDKEMPWKSRHQLNVKAEKLFRVHACRYPQIP